MSLWDLSFYGAYSAIMMIASASALWHFVIFSAEWSAARKQHHLPYATNRCSGLAFIFTKNILPKVEKDRRRLRWAIWTLVLGGLWPLGMALLHTLAGWHPQ